MGARLSRACRAAAGLRACPTLRSRSARRPGALPLIVAIVVAACGSTPPSSPAPTNQPTPLAATSAPATPSTEPSIPPTPVGISGGGAARRSLAAREARARPERRHPHRPWLGGRRQRLRRRLRLVQRDRLLLERRDHAGRTGRWRTDPRSTGSTSPRWATASSPWATATRIDQTRTRSSAQSSGNPRMA